MEPDLSYDEHPIKILNQKEKSTRRKVVKMYKIQWNHHTEEEVTWISINIILVKSQKGMPIITLLNRN